jgi:DNA-binding winged helix-turn-helix (wHTH) protein
MATAPAGKVAGYAARRPELPLPAGGAYCSSQIEEQHSDKLPSGMNDPQPARRYRFGVFEADAATGELRKQGIRIQLNAQPFQVLLMLLESPGVLLTRKEISRELWPEGTFVDYEHGVNSAVNRVREAPGDIASSPRFIETLAGRGYRFVAPVERIAANGNSSQAPLSLEQSATPSQAVRRVRILASPEELPRVSHSVAQTFFVLLQLMYVGFYVGALANLAEIEDLFSPRSHAVLLLIILITIAAILIPVRAFVLSAALFRAPRVRDKFFRLWPFLLPLDELWALSPFFLLHHIDLGLALSCTALLVYSPFAQRSLVLTGAGGTARELPAAPVCK